MGQTNIKKRLLCGNRKDSQNSKDKIKKQRLEHQGLVHTEGGLGSSM